MTSHCKPTSPFWTTVTLVVVLVGYPLSFGPACWVRSHVPYYESRPILKIYWPLSSLVLRCPCSVFQGFLSYGERFSDDRMVAWITLMQPDDEEPPGWIEP